MFKNFLQTRPIKTPGKLKAAESHTQKSQLTQAQVFWKVLPQTEPWAWGFWSFNSRPVAFLPQIFSINIQFWGIRWPQAETHWDNGLLQLIPQLTQPQLVFSRRVGPGHCPYLGMCHMGHWDQFWEHERAQGRATRMVKGLKELGTWEELGHLGHAQVPSGNHLKNVILYCSM